MLAVCERQESSYVIDQTLECIWQISFEVFKNIGKIRFPEYLEFFPLVFFRY